ncbi:MAG TPA: hypothetical protein PLD40_07855 [Kiritimatiellia bacterium]|mgnify:CR=1 FL=1|nr:hypothetical protein [Kiritimatiellia bacterium]
MSGAIIGHALVSTGIDNSRVGSGLNELKSKVSAGVSELRGIFAIQLAGVARQVISSMMPILQMAADQQGALKRFSYTYKEQAGELSKWIDAFAERTAAGGNEAMEMFTKTSNALRQMGIEEEAVPNMTKHIMKLAADLKAFNPEISSIDEAVAKLSGGLLGGVKGLRSLGISMRQSTLDSMAARLGISKATMATDDAARATAALHAILERGGAFIGAQDRAMDEYGEKIRQLTMHISEFKEAIGLAIIDSIKPFMETMIEMVQSARAFMTTNPEVAASLGKLAEAMTAVVIGAIGIGIALTSFGSVVGLLMIIGAAVLYVGEAFRWWDVGMTAAFKQIYIGSRSLQTWLTTFGDNLLLYFKTWGKLIGRVIAEPFYLLESVFAAIMQTIFAGLYTLFSGLGMTKLGTKMSDAMDAMEDRWKSANKKMSMKDIGEDFLEGKTKIKADTAENIADDTKRKADRDAKWQAEKDRLQALRAAKTEMPELPGWTGKKSGGAGGVVGVGTNLMAEMMGALFAQPATEGEKQTGFLKEIADSVAPLNDTLNNIAKDSSGLKGKSYENKFLEKKVLEDPALQTTFQKKLDTANAKGNVDLFQLVDIMTKSYEEQKKISKNTENAVPAYA